MRSFRKTFGLRSSKSSVNAFAPAMGLQSRRAGAVRICQRLDITVVVNERPASRQVNWLNRLAMIAIRSQKICKDDVRLLPALVRAMLVLVLEVDTV